MRVVCINKKWEEIIECPIALKYMVDISRGKPEIREVWGVKVVLKSLNKIFSVNQSSLDVNKFLVGVYWDEDDRAAPPTSTFKIYTEELNNGKDRKNI
jgi:hypothetical protein